MSKGSDPAFFFVLSGHLDQTVGCRCVRDDVLPAVVLEADERMMATVPLVSPPGLEDWKARRRLWGLSHRYLAERDTPDPNSPSMFYLLSILFLMGRGDYRVLAKDGFPAQYAMILRSAPGDTDVSLQSHTVGKRTSSQYQPLLFPKTQEADAYSKFVGELFAQDRANAERHNGDHQMIGLLEAAFRLGWMHVRSLLPIPVAAAG